MDRIVDGQTVTVKMPSRFNANTPREIVTELQELPHGEWRYVALDMSETVSMDSSGIGVLVFLYKELTARSKAFVLKRPHTNIYGLLAETGIIRLFDIELSSGLKKSDVGLGDLNVHLEMKDEMRGDVCVVAMNGVMSYPAGSTMFKKNMFAIIAKSNKILLDFSNLAFFDGLSVGSVLRISRILMDNGGAMKICCANQIVRNVFEGMGLDAIVRFFETVEEAMEDWDSVDMGELEARG